MDSAKPEKVDAYQQITDAIVTALERGTVPWIRPWTGHKPHNGATGHIYAGINAILTGCAPYPDPRWYTFKQVQAFGSSHVRKGERGTRIVRWIFLDPAEDAAPDAKRRPPILKVYVVFNHAQVEWDPSHKPADLPTPDAHAWDRYHAAENAISAYHDTTKIPVVTALGASYAPSADRISMPDRARFPEPGAYYATHLHEIAHSTGHPLRLARKLDARFGSEAYAAEELIAELSAAFLCADLRVDGHLQHDSYIASWIRVLRSDKRAIFTAAKHAREAVAYVKKHAGIVDDAAPSSETHDPQIAA